MNKQLEDMLVKLGIQLGEELLTVLIPEIGEAMIAGFAALAHRFAEANPKNNDAKGAVNDAAEEAAQIVREVEVLPFGDVADILSGDEVKELRFKTAVADLIGRHEERGMTLLRNDAELLVKMGVARLRTGLVELASGNAAKE